MTSVFIIESGSYSDKHIYGIFSTKELAEEHNKLVPDSSGVQEWPVDVIKEPEDDCFSLLVCMRRDGSIHHIYIGYCGSSGFDEYRDESAMKEKMICWIAATPDVTKAVKIVNEKRTQILAMNIWGNDKATREYFSV